MIKNEKVSSTALFLMLMLVVLGDMPIHTPVSSSEAKQDSWLGFALGWAGGFILMGIYVAIIKLNPSKTLYTILKDSFGKIAGSLLIILYTGYFVTTGSLVVRQFGDFVVTTNYNQTPTIIVLGLLLLLISYSLKSGLEVTSRIYGILAVIYIISVLLLTVILIPQYDFNNLFPFLEHGFTPVLKAGFTSLGFPFGELVYFLTFYTLANQSVNIKKVTFSAIAIGGFLVFINVLRDIMVLGPDFSANQTFPSYVAALIIPKPWNIKPLTVGSLLIGSSIETTFYMYACTLGVTQLFNLEEYRPFVFPMAALMTLISLWNFSNFFQFFDWLDGIFPYFALPFQTIIPLILLIISFFKKKKNVTRAT